MSVCKSMCSNVNMFIDVLSSIAVSVLESIVTYRHRGDMCTVK